MSSVYDFEARDIRGEPLDEGEIRVEEGIDEDDEHVLADERTRELDGTRRAVLDGLLDEMGVEVGILLADVALDLLLEVPGDENGLANAELLQIVENVPHHRPVAHAKQGFRRDVGMRTQPRALACERDDDFHDDSSIRWATAVREAGTVAARYRHLPKQSKAMEKGRE